LVYRNVADQTGHADAQADIYRFVPQLPLKSNLYRQFKRRQPHEHMCLLFENHQDWLSAIVPYIHVGLDSGEKCLYISDVHSQDELIEYLSAAGLDIEKHLSTGQFIVYESSGVYHAKGIFDPGQTIQNLVMETESAISEGYPSLRVTGEMSWALDGLKGTDCLIEYESLLNSQFFDHYPTQGLCQYDLGRFEISTIKEVINTHPWIVWKGKILENCYYIPPEERVGTDRYSNEVFRWLKHLEIQNEKRQSVEESEALYRALINLGTEVGEGIIMSQDVNGKEGIITFASEQCSRISGYKLDELLGKSTFDLISPPYRKESLSRHRTKMSGQALPGLYELDIVRKDGTHIPVEITSAISNYHGEPANVIYLRDITKKKQLEQQIRDERDKARKYLDVANVIIIGLDAECRIILINRKGCQILGYSRKEILGKDYIDTFIPDNNKGDVRDICIRLMKGQIKPVEYFENPVLTSEGNERIIAWHNSILKDNHGNIVAALGSGEDVTELRAAARKLEQYHQRLEKLVEERTKALKNQVERRVAFSRTLVHELKTPLTPMLGASEMLVNQLESPPLKRLAANLYTGTRNLYNRINDLIDFNKGEVGILKLNLNKTDVSAVLVEIGSFMRPEAIKRGQKLIVAEAATLTEIELDEERYQQIIINLLDNAMKNTCTGGTINLSATTEGNRLVTSITDTGKGINRKDQKNLFNRSYPSGSSKSQKGLGLGLPLCKMLVELHGGSIWVESQPGRGSTFSFSIPLEQQNKGRTIE